MMKKLMMLLVLAAGAVFAGTTLCAAEEMSKSEAADYLQQLMKKKVEEAAEKQVEKQLKKASPAAAALYKKLGKVIAAEQLAASLCWDLIKLGLQNDKKQFAAQFAIRMRKYIPLEYKVGASEVNELVGKWGIHVPDEADCTTALYELGKNTFDAITKMSAYEKQEARTAGNVVTTLGAFLVSDLGGNPGRMYQKQMREQMEQRQQQNRQRMMQQKK